LRSFAARTLYSVAPDISEYLVRWLIRTQRPDGSWGFSEQSTAEETAYCLQALLFWDKNVDHIDAGVLDFGVQYLLEHFQDQTHPPLWIGKSLYTPVQVVNSAILSVLYAYFTREN
jgi:halimadienyl-diphosphate synthase